MLNKDWISGVLAKYENKPSDAHEWGKVLSVNADGSYQVATKGGTMRCESGCAASAGDVVWVCVTTDGKAVAQARKGGEGGTGGGGSGENGATFYPSVDTDGNLSWTNDKGLTNPATVNIAGADGIYYGTEEPTQDPPPVWINPEGTLDPEDVVFPEQDPTVPAWAKQPNPPTYTAADVGADASGAAADALDAAKAYTDEKFGSIDIPQIDLSEYAKKSDLLSLVYPIGSIYMSVNSTDPAAFIGGTWERLQNRFLLGAGSTYASGSTGGEAEHALTLNETPAHTHTRGTMNITGALTERPCSSSAEILNSKANGAFTSHMAGDDLQWGVTVQTSGSSTHKNNLHKFDASRSWTGETSSVGGGAAHNNMPPYLAVYMWKRTA